MDLDQVESVLKLMQEYQVNRFEYEDEGMNLTVDMGAPTAFATPMTVAPPVPVAPVAPPAKEDPVQKEGTMVTSPMVGTFYRAAKPGAPPFVEVGAKVTSGQVLCILEAMKLMNELECEVSGTVAEILIDNAQPVQFGQELFRIIPD